MALGVYESGEQQANMVADIQNMIDSGQVSSGVGETAQKWVLEGLDIRGIVGGDFDENGGEA